MAFKNDRFPYPGNAKEIVDRDSTGEKYDDIYRKLSSEERERRRHFNLEERTALLILALGRCQKCNAVLGDDWEADHVVPFAHGGLTDITNGQALCRSCNRKKGDRY